MKKIVIAFFCIVVQTLAVAKSPSNETFKLTYVNVNGTKVAPLLEKSALFSKLGQPKTIVIDTKECGIALPMDKPEDYDVNFTVNLALYSTAVFEINKRLAALRSIQIAGTNNSIAINGISLTKKTSKNMLYSTFPALNRDGNIRGNGLLIPTGIDGDGYMLTFKNGYIYDVTSFVPC
ncbi:hypothetical protein [Hydromonas duriensis]|nr:hypothetical protein [Hydromonas duriensis]